MTKDTKVQEMFEVGAHFGYVKSRRHPSVSSYIFGVKNNVEIFDLEKTIDLLEEAKRFASEIIKSGKSILFVSGKKEAADILKSGAIKADQPYVVGRWIGGTLTNFNEIQKRTGRLEKLTTEKEKGELAKYTKKERLLIEREIIKLDDRFGGISDMKEKPGALFVIDAKQEDIAVAEANKNNIPVISLCSTDCDITKVQFPILANDSSVKSIDYFVKQIVEAISKGKKNQVK